MIPPLKVRLAVTAAALMVVFHTGVGHAQVGHSQVGHVQRGAKAAPAYRVDPVVAQTRHISVQTAGKGSPVILIPGLSSPRAVWDGVAPGLAASHRVYIVQVNGFGGDDPRGNLAPGILDGIVEDLHATIVRDRLTRVAVIGHSMGGLVAMMLAKTHPGDVGTLMIVDSLPYIGDIFAPGATVAMMEPQARAMRAGMASAYGKPVDQVASRTLAARMALTPAARTQVSAWTATADARVSAQAMYEDLTTDLRPDMAKIAAPITMVYPWAAEGGVPKAAAEGLYHRAYADAPKVTFVPIADSGHFVMLDQPAAFAAAVRAFVGD